MNGWGEDEVTRVLRGLRDVKAAPGMEMRVLERLARERAEALRRGPRWVWRWRVAGMAVVLGAVALGGVVLLLDAPGGLNGRLYFAGWLESIAVE